MLFISIYKSYYAKWLFHTLIAVIALLPLLLFLNEPNYEAEQKEVGAVKISKVIPVKYVKTTSLNISYLEYGEDNKPVIILLHGFPDDAWSWDKVATDLAKNGYRVIAPFIRGFGNTTFISKHSKRTGQLAALVNDLLLLTESLNIKQFTVAGHDWGGRIAQAVAAKHPERVKKIISFSGYSISYSIAGPPPINFLPNLWYQATLNMPIGKLNLYRNRIDFLYQLWKEWTPTWNTKGRNAEFLPTNQSFTNPDFIPIVISAYSFTGFNYNETVGWVMYAVFNTLYFGLKSPVLGSIDTILGLIILIITVIKSFPISKKCFCLLVLRLIWLLLATYVSVYVALNNKDELLSANYQTFYKMV